MKQKTRSTAILTTFEFPTNETPFVETFEISSDRSINFKKIEVYCKRG